MTALPTTALVATNEVDPQYVNEKPRVQQASGPGSLGRAYTPFDPSAGSETLGLMRPNLDVSRLENRRALLGALDGIQRTVDASGAMASLDRFEQRAFDLILRNAGDALDIAKEDPRVRERYDTSAFQVGFKRFRRCTLGRQMLMARRLIEAGCGFVTVHNAGWDMHADVNNPGIKAGMEQLGPPVDHAVAAFLDDVRARGLSEKVLLVITGDFGLTPRVNKNGGRDHWAALSTLALAGGGLRMGQVIGSSTSMADAPASQPITPADLMNTLMHFLFDVSALRLEVGVPREIAASFGAGEPIPGLF